MSIVKRFIAWCGKERADALAGKHDLEKRLENVRKIVQKENRKPDDPTMLQLINQYAEERVIPDLEAQIFLKDQRLFYIDDFEKVGQEKLMKEEQND